MNPMQQWEEFDNHEAHLERMSAEWAKVGKSKKRLAEFIQQFGKQQAEQMKLIDKNLKKR